MSRGLRLLALLGMAAAAPACGGTLANLPTAPTPTISTDTFSGTLTRNGAATYPFAALQSGNVTASLTSVGSDNTIPIGLGLGTWNGSACQILLANDSATPGVLVKAIVNAAGSLCVRVYDVGNVVGPLSYEVNVVHP
jgi:hypothetical protein